MDVYLRWLLLLGCFLMMMWMMRGMGGMGGGNRSRDMNHEEISNLGGQTGVDQLRIAQLEREVAELRAGSRDGRATPPVGDQP